MALRKAVENAEDDPEKAWEELLAFNVRPVDTVIGIAASGTTPWVIGGVRKAREAGLLTGCITCNPGSEIARPRNSP